MSQSRYQLCGQSHLDGAGFQIWCAACGLMCSSIPTTGRSFPLIHYKCISLLKLCASSLPKLKQIHAFSIRHGADPTSPDFGKYLLFAAVSLSEPGLSYSRRIFSSIRTPNIFTWNTLIRGYAESNSPGPAVEVYRQMRASCIHPDTHTYPFLLKAIAKLTSIRQGEMVHCIVVRDGYESLVYVQNSLVHMYASCGDPEGAHNVFDLMSERDVVAWNTVINGFAVNGKPNEALTLFQQMSKDDDGVDPDGFTMVSLLTACAEVGALALGRRIHVYMVKAGLCSNNVHTNNALLDLYAKCGSVKEARSVFREMGERNVVSWTSLIVGLAVNGFGKEAIRVFEEEFLKEKGMVPTEITFVGVLYACSHCGMVDEGFDYFRKMRDEYGIAARMEHYGCMVDLLGRAGLVERAHTFITKGMVEDGVKPNSVIWRILLAACTVHGNKSGLAEVARARLMELEPRHSGDYVLLSNLYALEKRWTEVQKVRTEMVRRGVRKAPGHSLVELGNRVFEFTTTSTTNEYDDKLVDMEEIYAKLEEMTRVLKVEGGYLAHTRNVMVDIEEEEKEQALSYHSEKIAVAFMLLNTGDGVDIRVVKNLRICGDCHLFIKLVSKLYNRQIVVRDRSRFHHFEHGLCSCNDYW